jgi:hypothetical protein
MARQLVNRLPDAARPRKFKHAPPRDACELPPYRRRDAALLWRRHERHFERPFRVRARPTNHGPPLAARRDKVAEAQALVSVRESRRVEYIAPRTGRLSILHSSDVQRL